MSESNPLAGLTGEQADQAIARLQDKVDAGTGGSAAKDHLKAMKAARKQLQEPVPVEEQGPGTVARAQAPGTVGGEG